MKYQVLLVFFIAGFACGEDDTDFYMPQIYDGLASEDQLTHPCPDLNNECVRKYFSDHSTCQPITETTQSVHRDSQVVYLSYCNMTVFYKDTEISGLDGEITGCHINEETNMFVVSVYFKGVTINVKDCRFAYHSVGKEPAVKGDGLNATYTATITSWTPIDSNGMLENKKTRVSAYVWDIHPVFHIGNAIMTGKDEQIDKSINCLMHDLPTGLQATFTTEAISYYNAWLKSQMCDFGSPVAFVDYFKG